MRRWPVFAVIGFVGGLALAQPKPPNVTATNGSFSTISATTATAATVLATTVKAGFVDAGSVYSPGAITGSYVTTTGAPGSATGTVPVTVGSRSASLAGIWAGTSPANATASNWTLVSDGISDTYLQGVNNVYIATNGVVVGTFGQTGNLAVSGKISSTNGTSCTLNGGTPSTCTATVTAGAKCNCTPVGATAAIAAAGCAVGLSSTTLTATSGAALTNVVNILCDK